MPEQFELFHQIEKNEPPEEKKEEAPKKAIRKPGSKFYEPELGSEKEQDEYVREVLGASKANIKERADKAAEKAHDEFWKKIRESEKREN